MEPPAGREDSCDCETLMWMKLLKGSKDSEQMQQSDWLGGGDYWRTSKGTGCHFRIRSVQLALESS